MIPVWTEAALCAQVEPDLWYPEGQGARTHLNIARRVCAVCPVQGPCLAYAMAQERGASHWERHGVWAGTTPYQRAVMDRIRLCVDCGVEVGDRSLHRVRCESCQVKHRRKAKAVSHQRRRAA